MISFKCVGPAKDCAVVSAKICKKWFSAGSAVVAAKFVSGKQASVDATRKYDEQLAAYLKELAAKLDEKL